MEKPKFKFDENLRSIPENPKHLKSYIQNMESSLDSIKDPKQYISVIGEMAVYLRMLGEFEKAETALEKSLKIIAKEKLGIQREVQQKIRLAHVLQDKKEFNKSNTLFAELIQTCRKNEEAKNYLAFALQHSGKNLFDQNLFTDALAQFEEALSLRKSMNAPQDQIESTELAIKRTKELLKA
ncbi:hypothetical protein [Bdellovibrio bacteriovorus]|uniref:hypothetical protein n=1 Tax=Bdellovibrio bacteriovorus TaxID=959 RepID=UPI0035A8EEC5